jgi:uroporphyrinogen-III synthase
VSTAAESMSLADYHVLVTRPMAQATPWAEQLRALGASVTVQPMLAIEALTDAASKQQITDRVLAFAEYQKAIFVSQNAVYYGLQSLDQYWPQLPLDVAFFAIGKVTAARLEDGIKQGVWCSSHGATNGATNSAMDSETLLAHEQLHSIEGEKILIFRGKGGRTILAEQLRARGARVDYCELYARRCPENASPRLDEDYRHTNKQAIVTVHSGETLANLCRIIQTDDLCWLREQVIVLPGQRVAEQAIAAGFGKVIVAANASHDSMVKALSEWQRHDG